MLNTFSKQKAKSGFTGDGVAFYMKLFPVLEKMFEQNINYDNMVRERIENGYYDVIALNDARTGKYNIEDYNVGKLYQEIACYDMIAGGQIWKTHFYGRIGGQ